MWIDRISVLTLDAAANQPAHSAETQVSQPTIDATRSTPSSPASNGRASASSAETPPREQVGFRRATIETPVTIKGPGLFTGQQVRLTLVPAQPDEGIFFTSVEQDADADPASRDDPRPLRRLRALLDHLEPQPRHTVLADDSLKVETVEHLLAGIVGAGLTDVGIQLADDGDSESFEIPMGDGSAKPFLDAIRKAGTTSIGGTMEPLIIKNLVQVTGEGGASLAALPGPTDALEIIYTFDGPEPLGRLVVSTRIDWTLSDNGFDEQLAPARTFIFEAEAEQLKDRGWGKHLTTKDLLVIGSNGPIDNSLRYPDEPARHKALDLIGDLALIGRPVCGRIYAHRSGHALNHELARELVRSEQTEQDAPALRERKSRERKQPLDPDLAPFAHLLEGVSADPVMDARTIQRILPHRFPMLLVDKVLEFDGDRRAVGVKNVTMGDIFFLGHYPKRPIFPGVLIVEAMGQLGGILMSRTLEHTGKIAILLSMNRVKLRQQVVPGDQLILVAEAQRVKSRTGQVACKAFVGQKLAAEAEIKFMLTDTDGE